MASAKACAAAPKIEPDRHVSVYDGRDLAGSVSGVGRDWRAFDAAGNQLPGEFKSMKAAVAAVNTLLPGAVCDANARRDNSP